MFEHYVSITKMKKKKNKDGVCFLTLFFCHLFFFIILLSIKNKKKVYFSYKSNNEPIIHSSIYASIFQKKNPSLFWVYTFLQFLIINQKVKLKYKIKKESLGRNMSFETDV
jgi:hypothetical protein